MEEVKKKSLYSWLLFDLANTVYAFIIPGLYFSVWLVSEKGWTDQQLGLATSSAMIVVAILGPFIGRKSDSSQSKKQILFVMTLICIISTFLLGTFSVEISVLLFIFSLIGFNLGSVVYDALLVSVSSEENRGKISGLGVAFGYTGSLIGFAIATLLQNMGYGYIEIFKSVALLFLIFSLPAFIFIKEKIDYSNKINTDSAEILDEFIFLDFNTFERNKSRLFLIYFLLGPTIFPIIFLLEIFLLYLFPTFSKYIYQIYILSWKVLLKIPVFKQIIVALLTVVKSWIHTKKYQGLTRFLVGRFFYADAINTLISGLLAVYLVEEVGLTPSDSQGILALAIVVSIIGGYVFGKAADTYGPRRLILISIFCWMLGLLLAIIATEFDQLWLIYVTGVLGGFNIGGIFAVDRVFMTRLSPEKHLGEFYGLYSTVGRFATIIGPILWGLIVNSLGLGRNVAMGSLILLLAISYYIIHGVSDKVKN